MNRQNTLVDECLNVLHEKEIEKIQKLRVEVQLCHLKRLLSENYMDDATAEFFTFSLMEVRRKIARLEGDEVPAAAFREVNWELQSIIDAVAGWTALNCEGAEAVRFAPA